MEGKKWLLLVFKAFRVLPMTKLAIVALLLPRTKHLEQMKSLLALLIAATLAVPVMGADSLAPISAPADELSLEQLISIQVTSVSKKETPLEQSPAAITVITSEDIRRLGIRTIPEALRLVPGMDVAQINGHEWAVSARGFNDQYANKLLVLVDGRAVYTPTFGGVFWNVQDIPMSDLDRIDVIRGPGATLWGANAVNGVVNIITKSAKDTQGVLVSVTGGTVDQPSATVRYGGQLATNLYYRGYVKYFNRDGLVDSHGKDAPDGSETFRTGARLDWEPTTANRLTLQGDYYRSDIRENQQVVSLTPPYSQSVNATDHEDGWNVLSRWTHDFSEKSQFSVQGYVDNCKEEYLSGAERHTTLDLDAQHRFALGEHNDVMWGLGYRYTHFNLPHNFLEDFNPNIRNDQLVSGFVQDEVTLIPDRLKVTGGTKLEHNDYTGFEVEPSGRIAWTPTDKQTVWAAISRAVRTPAIYNTTAQVNEPIVPAPPSPVPVYISLFPNPGLHSESLIAYELGYRIEPAKNLSVDLATFYNVYDDLIVYVPGTPFFDNNPTPHTVVPVNTANAGHGNTYGGELSIQWQPFDRWRLIGSYSLFQTSLRPKSGFTDSAPEHQFQIRSYVNLTRTLEFNSFLSYQDRIVSTELFQPQSIPSYVRLDLGMVWHPKPWLELGLWGQNLLQDSHQEFPGETTLIRTEVPRSVLAKITCTF